MKPNWESCHHQRGRTFHEPLAIALFIADTKGSADALVWAYPKVVKLWGLDRCSEGMFDPDYFTQHFRRLGSIGKLRR